MSLPVAEEVCAKCSHNIRLQHEKHVRCKICEESYHYNCSDIDDQSHIGDILDKNENFHCGSCLNDANISLLTNEIKENIQRPGLGMRHVQALLLFLGIATYYTKSLTVGVAVVAMTNAEAANPDFPEFDWTAQQKSYILSSLFWGATVAQFPGGVLCKRYGVKLVMGLAVFTSSALNTFIPWAVTWGGWQVFCAIRAVQGLSEGMVFPCIYQHLSKWAPWQERNRLGAMSLTGFDCAKVLAMAISGIIAEGPLGWPGISYVTAGMCFMWCLLWLVFGANNPQESRFITDLERDYIETSLAHSNEFHKKKIPIPWKAIFRSAPFYMLIIIRCAELWGISTLEQQIPSYLHGVFNMEIKANGLFSALPFLTSWLMTYVFMALADILQQRNVLNLTALRRVFNSIAFWTPAIGLIVIGFLDGDNKNAALALMTISLGVNSAYIVGSMLNIIDLSPNHAAFLSSIINMTSAFMLVISPLVVGEIVTDIHNRSQWQIVFAIAAAFLFVGNLLYIILGSTETQPWDAEDFLLQLRVNASNSGYSELEVSAKASKGESEMENSPLTGDDNIEMDLADSIKMF